MTHEEVWAILVEECGAETDSLGHGYEAFEANWPECREFRFIGALGFGGKIHAGGRGAHKVSMYQESATPERAAMVERANRRLTDGWWSSPWPSGHKAAKAQPTGLPEQASETGGAG